MFTEEFWAESRPVQKVQGNDIFRMDSGPEGFSWWVTAARIDPFKESREFLRGSKGLEDQPAAHWKSVVVPANLPDTGVLPADTTEFWYRKVIHIASPLKKNLSVRLGFISDRDRVYFNGELIGGFGAWDAQLAQSYDRLRIYEIPTHLTRPDQANILLIHGQSYFHTESGIYQDYTAIGPTWQISHDYYMDNTIEILILSFYLAVGCYFLFLFVRRLQDRENLYFGLFIWMLIGYQFLRTQLKYEMDFDFFVAKKIEYMLIVFLVPLFYLFIRNYYKLPNKLWVRIQDRIIMALNILPVLAAVTFVTTDTIELWWDIMKSGVQPSWLLYIVVGFTILINRMLHRDLDGFIMFGGFTVLVGGVVLDTLSDRGLFNIPRVSQYSFIIFILNFALILANRYVRLQKESERLNVELRVQALAFHRFVPTQFLELLGKSEMTEIVLGDSTKLNMSVLFSDLRSFTALSEQMGPEDNFRFLNGYLKRMEPGIQKYGGFVDKFVGDAIMALFPGNTLDGISSADQAVSAAIDMHSNLKEYNKHRIKRNFKPLASGVGINSGDLMLGTVGSRKRLDTTVIGDSVNLSARLESLTSVYKVRIIISGRTYRELNSMKQGIREIDNIVVKGKQQAVIIYEVFAADHEQMRNLKEKTLDAFNAGMDCYKGREFEQAVEHFRGILKIHPEDYVTKIYLNRCKKLVVTPPSPSWKGAVRVRFK